jgi:hypothetical protein
MEVNYIEQYGESIYNQMKELGYRKFSRWDLTKDDLINKLKIPEDVIFNLVNDKKHFVFGAWYVFKHKIRGNPGYGMGYDPDLIEEFNILEE